MTQRGKFRVAVIATAVVLCFVCLSYPQTSPAAVAIATIGLLYVTFEYLLVTRENLDLTQQNLDLLRRQLQRQEIVAFHFDLTVKDNALWLRVSNLGLSNFLLQAVHVRKPDDTGFEFETHRIVQSGKTEEITLPDSLYRGEGFGVDLELTLEYMGLDGGGKTSPKCFNVFLGLRGEAAAAEEGLDALWYARCPQCKISTVANVIGLKTFSAAQARVQRLREDLAASCPDHKSEFLLTVEDVRAHNKEKARHNSTPL